MDKKNINIEIRNKLDTIFRLSHEIIISDYKDVELSEDMYIIRSKSAMWMLLLEHRPEMRVKNG